MEIAQQVGSVLLVLAMLAGAAWLLNRKKGLRLGWANRGSRRGAALEVVERLPLSAQHSLHLVRMADRALLVSAHAGGCTLLESRSWDDIERGDPRPRAMAEVSR